MGGNWDNTAPSHPPWSIHEQLHLYLDRSCVPDHCIYYTYRVGQEGTLYCRSSKDKCTLVPPCQTVPSTTNPLDVSSQNVMLALPVKEISCLKAVHPALLLHRSKSQLLSPGSRLPSPGSRIWIPPREVEPVMIAVPLLISHQSNSSNLAFYLLCIVQVPYLPHPWRPRSRKPFTGVRAHKSCT